MKKLFLMLFALSLISTTSCNKDDDNNNCQGIDCLPPATQTGAGTFGCLVNGQPFVDNSGFFNCFYQLVDGEYYFNLSADFNSQLIEGISLATNKLEISANESYPLLSREENNFYAEVTFDFNPPTFLNDNTTDEFNTGGITITELNFQSYVVSGIFNFKVRDTVNNITYHITDGRFDSHFTQ